MGTVAVCLSMHLLRTCLKPDVAVLQLVWVAGEAANMFEYDVQPVLSLQHTIFHPGPVKLLCIQVLVRIPIYSCFHSLKYNVAKLYIKVQFIEVEYNFIFTFEFLNNNNTKGNFIHNNFRSKS